MKAAAAVTVRLTRFAIWHAVVLALGGLSTAALGLTVVQFFRGFQAQNALEAAWMLGLLLTGMAAIVFAVARLWCRHPLDLAWTGQAWRVGDNEGPWRVDVMLDLGRLLLLRAQTGSARVWLPVELPQLGVDAHALRCALFADPAGPSGASASSVAQQPLSL